MLVRLEQDMVTLTGAQALVAVLKSCGINNYYGVCGGNLGGILRALSEDSDLRYIGCRHEAAGAFMAAGLFAATGKIGACIAELGPGTVNLVGGLGVAVNNNLPLVAITSSLGQHKSSPLNGAMMELDNTALTASVTKWNCQIRQVGRIPEIVRWAIREALTGKPGPVHLDIPADVMTGSAEFSRYELSLPAKHFVASLRAPVLPELAQAAAALLTEARRPLLLAGGGCIYSDAVSEFRELKDRLGAAATTTQAAIGAVSTDDPRFIGHAGALGGAPVVRALREADVVLAVGCRFSSWLRADGPPITPGLPGQKIIHIDVDPAALGRAQAFELGLLGDARTILRQILAALPRDTAAQADAAWLDSLCAEQQSRVAELRQLAAEETPTIHPAFAAQEFGRWLPADSFVVYDGGHTSFWTNDLTPALSPRVRFNDSGMAQLGFGTPFAHGIKAAFPDRPVFNVLGDGSFGFTIQELDTARRHGLNVVHVIHNNAAWGVIRSGQKAGGFDFGGDLSGTNYAAIARGFGCHGEVVEDPKELRDALQRALQSGLPSVVDIRTSHVRHPNMAYFGASLR